MSKIPTRSVASGTGLPRLIKLMAAALYTSVGSPTYAATSVSEPEGSAATITTSSAASPTLITTSGAHGLSVGQYVRITGHTGSTPALDGVHRVIEVPLTTTFKVSFNLSVGGSGGTVKRTPAFSERGIIPGMRVSAVANVAGMAGTLAYAKISTVNAVSGGAQALTIDEWVNGTPTNANAFSVDGWVGDLPRCEKLIEINEPDVLVHHVYRKKSNTKQFGWIYSAVLNYQSFISPDDLFELRKIFNFAVEGSSEIVIFIPRKDKPGFNYRVYFSDPIQFSLHPSLYGHRDFAIGMKGKENIPIPAQFAIAGYGTGYGSTYGTQL